MIRRIRDLLYDQGFTISGARNQLQDGAQTLSFAGDPLQDALDAGHVARSDPNGPAPQAVLPADLESVRRELFEIRGLLSVAA